MGRLGIAEEGLAALVLVAMAGSVAVVAVLAARRWAPGSALDRWTWGVLLAIAQMVGVPLVLGGLGILSRPTAVAAHLLLAGAALARWRPSTATTAGGTEPWALGGLDRAGLAAGVGYAVAAVGWSLRRARSFDFDTKEYHLSNLAEWLQSGSIWGLPYAQPGSVTATHPGNGELLGLWLALPSHGDELVYAAPALCGVLAILAAAVIGRELRGGASGGAGLGALAAVAVLTAPLYLATQLHSLSTDLPAASGLLAAVALVLVARRTDEVAPVALAGVALGLGIGAKYTAFVPGALVALAAVPLLRDRRWWWLVPGTAGFAGPWFVRNLAQTGNPLFPQDLVVLDGGQSPYDVLNTSMLHHLTHREGEVLRRWVDLGSDLVGPVALALLAGAAVALWRRRASRDPVAVAVVALLGVGAFGAYLATPVTGGGPTGLAFIIASCFRYGMAAMLLGAALWAGVASSRVAAGSLAVVLAWNGWRALTATSPRPDIDITGPAIAGAGVALVVGLAVAALAGRGRGVGRPGLPAAVLAGLALAVGVAGVLHRNDRGDQVGGLEALVLAFGDDRPALVLGVADLRAVLGPRLERPLVGVSRGGEADELPFADEAQLRRRVLGQDEPAPDPGLGLALDGALDRSGVDLLLVGSDNPVAYPDGWEPSGAWCRVGGDDQGALYVRAAALPADGRCRPSRP